MKKAFTLIELLVVVLIIGILSAIALPQYEMTVVKSRFTTIFPLVRSVKDAQERHYMANNSYTLYMDELDIDVSLYAVSTDRTALKFGNEFFLFNSGSSQDVVVLKYCPGYNTDYSSCHAHEKVSINWYFDHDTTKPGQRSCYGPDKQKICKLFAGWTD